MQHVKDPRIEVVSLDALPDEDTFAEDTKVDPNTVLSPERQDEISVSGQMPDPESDDDTLQNAHQMGEQIHDTLARPEELAIDKDIDTAENNLKDH